MIDETKLSELRKHYAGCSSAYEPCPITDAFEEISDTLEALWKVARAAEEVRECESPVSKGEVAFKKLVEALAALETK